MPFDIQINVCRPQRPASWMALVLTICRGREIMTAPSTGFDVDPGVDTMKFAPSVFQ